MEKLFFFLPQSSVHMILRNHSNLMHWCFINFENCYDVNLKYSFIFFFFLNLMYTYVYYNVYKTR